MRWTLNCLLPCPTTRQKFGSACSKRRIWLERQYKNWSAGCSEWPVPSWAAWRESPTWPRSADRGTPVASWYNSYSPASPWKSMEISRMDASWPERSSASSAKRCTHKLFVSPSEFRSARQLGYWRRKLCSLVNHTRERQWLERGQFGTSTLKTELHTQKAMLSVSWNCRGVFP